jgi:hypothetical protein
MVPSVPLVAMLGVQVAATTETGLDGVVAPAGAANPAIPPAIVAAVAAVATRLLTLIVTPREYAAQPPRVEFGSN